MANGKVVIAADMDDTPANKKLMKLRDTVEKLENDFNSKSQKKTALEEELETAKWAADDAREAVRGLNEEKKQLEAQREGLNPSSMEYQNVSAQIVEIDRRYKEAKVALDENVKEAARLEKELNKVSDSAAKTETKLNASKTELGEMEAKLAYQDSFWGRINKGAKDTEKSIGKVGGRIAGLVKSAFVFSVITMGLQKVREYMSKTLQKNAEFQSSLASLKGALLTAFQPIYNVIVPALITLMKVITTVITAIAHLFSLFGGKSAKQNAADAKALNAKADAISGVGGAASKAEKQLASFDEINQLSDTAGGGGGCGAGGAAAGLIPDFSGIDELTDKMRILRDLVAMVGGAILGWKLAKILGYTGGKAAALAAAFAGCALMITGVADAWNNGLNWKNMLEILGGAALLVFSLGKAFGNVGAAIGLLIAGIAMLVIGIKDYLTVGELTTKNLTMIVGGIAAIGIALSILTGSWIPLVIAAIVGLLLIFADSMGEGENLIDGFIKVVKGIIDFLVGVFTLDWEKAWNGLKDIVSGVVDIMASLINSIKTAVGKVIDKIKEALGLQSKFDSKSGIKGVASGGVGGTGGAGRDGRAAAQMAKIPALARGAVIPPNREFLAVLGDQRSGTNIEAPLDTIVQAFRLAMRDMNSGQSEAVLYIGEQEMGKLVYRLNNQETRRIGVSLTGA